MPICKEALDILNERFGHDTLLALATVENGRPRVRHVNACYWDGAFYVITYALSNKMKQLKKDPHVAVCGEWFTAQGTGHSLGHVLAPENAPAMEKLRAAFADWYGNGHVNEADPNTCLLQIRLTEGTLFSHGTRYDLVFDEE